MHGVSPGEVPFPIDSMLGLVSLADPDSQPVGASPRTSDTDFIIGNVKTRAGLKRTYNQSTGSIGPNNPAVASSSTWNNPNGILGNLSAASFSPVSNPNSLNAQDFGFNISALDSVTGIELTVNAGASAPATIQAQLLIAGVPAGDKKTVDLVTGSNGIITFASPIDSWGLILAPAVLNSLTFGVQFTALVRSGFTGAEIALSNAQFTVGINTGGQTMQPLETFVNQNGSRYNLVLDQGGNLWVENLDTDPGVLAITRTGIEPGSVAVEVQGQGVAYLAFVKPLTLGGSDMPLQWSPSYCDRITQVGPGVAPQFVATQASSQNYAIDSITQPAQKTQGSSYFLQSAGPGNNQPGNVVTIYYLDATVAPGPDSDLVAAFNSGYPVYLYVSFTGTPVTFGPQVVLVTAVGEAQPPGQPRNFYYFTFQVASTAYTYYAGSGHPGYTVTYQRSLATLTTADPVPNLQVGSQMAITGVTPSAWNGTWTVTQTPNASEMVITGSQVTAGVATFNYSVTNGTANPAPGDLVTIANTLNAGGQLNVTQWPIASVSGGSSGTFTVNGFPGTLTAAFETENGYANTSGTIFDFDPGAALVGTGTDPIYGNAGAGGDVVFNASGVFIDPGTYQGTVFFITRRGYYTAPAPPVVFTVPDNTTQLSVSGIPIGPPNVVARAIAITEAGQNGVPGANFFTLPNPVDFYVSGSKQTATSFFINDNTTIAQNLFFTSAILNSATAVDIYGYNLFNQIEIGDPSFILNYSTRNFYSGCVNKVQNFVNLSFDGGYIQSSKPVPAGWSQPDTYGVLMPSPLFGNSYYISNPTASTLDQAGLIEQPAFQDAYQTAILNPNVGYSVRVRARSPSGATVGSLVIALVSGSTVVGTYSINLSAMGTAFSLFTGILLPDPGIVSIPENLMIQVYASGLGAGADVEIDRFDVVPTAIPVLTTTMYGSYAGLPQQVDGVTGQVVFTSENQQPIQAATVLYDTMYVAKGWSGTAPGSSLYSLRASAGLEPSDWDEPEVAQRSGGAVGPLAAAGGEQWFLACSRAGLYLFVGGQPGKISQEIQEVWDAINWNAAGSIWINVNLKARKILIGVPMPTPNFWLPYAPADSSPTSPNVVLMCNFQGLDSGEELRGEPQMHVTMFGKLTAVDMRRKWSIWRIPSPFAATVQGVDDEETRFGNGISNSQVYTLDASQATDDGAAIDSVYTTAGVPQEAMRQQMPQLGRNRTRWTYLIAALASGGTVNVRMLSNHLFFPEPSGYVQWTIPGGFTPGAQPLNDVEASINFPATRTFIEFRQNDGNFGWTLSNLMMILRKDVWNTMRGIK